MIRIHAFKGILLAAALSTGALPAAAQIRSIDPNEAIDADLAPVQQDGVQQGDSTPATPNNSATPDSGLPVNSDPLPPATATPAPPAATTSRTAQQQETYERGDLIGAAEGVFGKGAEGLAGLIENILKDQGEPNAYITGEEASGAFVVGLRYGSGTLHHKIEGNRPVYWTGPSIGFDAGANASKSFVLVYNLHDSQDLYRRYPQGEGAGYFVGGFSASYLRRGDVVLIPVRLGAGLRLGANVGYMKFSEKGRWLPF
ncbi:DUF1134 domain-containing protein [Sphingomonas cavernae]|uniref:DUF1134 domain-containing protein n=1 Tax=Sphingomonas cavernae TaxID=2320861 RepID=A0A418WSX9_9SPHN|nr:DUF1134 domain-containing protein [Sphingomonas cavernae]RJF94286.1 DUF1134 domain-containing protein [Sphingomonas cavernae]